MKKYYRVIICTLIMSLGFSTVVLAYDRVGWEIVGKPIFTKSNSSINNKSDISGTSIMRRVRSSYSYTRRMPQIANSRYIQNEFLVKNSNGHNVHNYTNITYANTPFGEVGYTRWYDSPYGLVLDYLTPYVIGKSPIDEGPAVSVQQDLIDYNNIQFPGKIDSAYIVTLDSDGELADGKVASYLGRNVSKYFPIYGNIGKSINNNVLRELKRKEVKNLYILGGSGRFLQTAGLSGDFNIIRIGGENRNETKDYMLNAPSRLTNPSSYQGDGNGIVMQGVPALLEGEIRRLLLEEKANRNSSALIRASEYAMNKLVAIGTPANVNSQPTMIIGVNDGVYESYWICYYKGSSGEYVYQYILGKYFPPKPQSDIIVKEYDYKESNNVYWVKPYSQFNLYTEGSVGDWEGKYPGTIEAWLHNDKFGSFDGLQSAKSSISVNTQGVSNQFTWDFNKVNVGDRATLRNSNGKNYIGGNHKLTAKHDNQDYNLASRVEYNGSWSNPKRSNLWIKTDGVAPVYNNRTLDRQEDTLKVGVDVTDARSGVKSVVASVWVDNGNGPIHKQNINTTKTTGNTYEFIANRNNFGGNRQNYYWQYTLTDNVGNVRFSPVYGPEKMLQYNLTANRIDIYDPRENRYVSQLVTGQEYDAVIEYNNTGVLNVKPNQNFTIGLNRDTTNLTKVIISSGISKGEKKETKIRFMAENTENLKGNLFTGIIDYDNNLDEENENDNRASTEKPYTTPVSDLKPPKIPTVPPGGKPTDPVPIITIQLDLVADYIDIVEINSDKVVTELITEDSYRVKFNVTNKSSLSLKYIDIANRTFENDIYYDGIKIGTHTIKNIDKNEIITLYTYYQVPVLPNGIIEATKEFKGIADSKNNIKESNENNNQISINKKVRGLKLIDYRITTMVHPITTHTYPIRVPKMPVSVKAGYNVTFRINVLGKADKVYSDVKDSRGKDYGRIELKKVKEIDNVRSEYEYVFAPHVETVNDTIILTNISADRGHTTYNFNSKEKWNGHTLKIGGNAEEDIVIFRKY